MIKPIDYYEAFDSQAKTLSEIKQNFETINKFATSGNYKVYWRGQSNHEWGLVSSLVRKLSAVTVLNDELLNKVEQKLLDEGSKWIQDLKNKPYTYPLAQLAYLQHYGIPTRLLDFTADPWMATFFASESNDDIDGRIFALIVDKKDVIDNTIGSTPWRTYGTNEVKIYDPNTAGVVFPRLQVQKGVLALGRLPSTQPHREAHDKELEKQRSLLAEEVRRILSIPMKLSKFDPEQGDLSIPKGAKTPIGLTFRIHVDKESVRRDLARKTRRATSPIKATHDIVYPDAAGMAAHSKILQGLEKGVLVL